jgi:hypothetical protein
MDALVYGQVKLPLIMHNVIAAIDSGTALIYVHETFAKAFYKLVSPDDDGNSPFDLLLT